MSQQQSLASLQLGRKRKIVLALQCLLLLVEFKVGVCLEDEGVLTIEGDIILGGLFPIHKKSESTENACGQFNEIPGYQYMEAMFFAIQEINNNTTLLPNITLGAQVYDTCQSKTIAADRSKEFIKMTLMRETKGQLAGVVGAFSSGVSETVANFLRVFEIPQISYSSTSVTLSNKDIYSYFLRTLAPDSFQAQAMVEVILRFGWSYVSTVNSAGTYGTKGIEIFIKNAKKNGICIGSEEKLIDFPSKAQYKRVMEKLVATARQTNATVVVLFCTQTDARHLLEAAKDTQGAQRFTWLGSDGWSNRVDVTATAAEAAEGALTIMVRRGEVVSQFKDYFTNLTRKNYPIKNKRYFEEFWKSRQASNASCHIEFSPVRVVINAVYAFAHALDNLQKELCPNQVGICAAMSPFQRSRLLEHLKNVSFQDLSLNTTVRFDKNGEVSAIYDIMNFQKRKGEYRYVLVGRWDGELQDGKIKSSFPAVDERNIKWLKGTHNMPASFCSQHCSLGAIALPIPNLDFKCCWQCKQCGKLQTVVNNTCHNGEEGWIPDTNRTGWVKRKVLYPKWSDSASIVLIFIALVSLALTSITFVVYIKYKNNRMVKASGRELCYVMLAGIGLCFITPFLFIAKPNDPLCYARNLVTGLALAMCYAALFMKINRIYRIFTGAKSSAARPPMISPRVQLLLTFALVSIQLMFTTLWFIAKPVRAAETYHSEREELVLECKVDQLSFSVNLCYVMVLMMLCTAYGFKTRNFPKNFNESKYIGITMYVTVAIWMTFFPFYLNSSNSFTHIYLISGACVTIGLVTLIGLFAQKIYIIFYVHNITTDDVVVTTTQKGAVSGGDHPHGDHPLSENFIMHER